MINKIEEPKPLRAVIPFTMNACANREEVRAMSHDAAIRHFDSYPDGNIHLLGLVIKEKNPTSTTFEVTAELRPLNPENPVNPV